MLEFFFTLKQRDLFESSLIKGNRVLIALSFPRSTVDDNDIGDLLELYVERQ